MKKTMIKLLAVGVAVAGAFATPAMGGTPEKAAKKSYLRFTDETKNLAKVAEEMIAGESENLQIEVEASSKKLTFTAKNLPKGLSINKKDGWISGKPTKPGSYTSTVTVKDDGGRKVSQKVKIRVCVPKFARGIYYGRVYTSSADLPSYLKLNVGKTGKVEGYVTTNKGKEYAFTAKFSGPLKFTPKIKIGSKTFKPGKVTIKNRGGLPDELFVPECNDAKGNFYAHKAMTLVKDKMPGMIRWSKTFKVGKDKLKIQILNAKNADLIEVTGKVNGKSLDHFAPLLFSNAKAINYRSDYLVRYTMYSFILAKELKEWLLFAIDIDVYNGEILTVDPELQ